MMLFPSPHYQKEYTSGSNWVEFLGIFAAWNADMLVGCLAATESMGKE